MFHHRFPPLGCIIVLLSLAVPGFITAQVLTPQTLATPEPKPKPPSQPESEPIPPPVSEPRVTSAPDPIVHEGPAVSPDARRFHYELKLDLRMAYDDNILLDPSDEIGDFNIRIDPSIDLSFGDDSSEANFLHFRYSPDAVLFFSHSEFDSFQHVLELDGHSNFGRLRLGLSTEAQFLNGTDITSATNAGTFVNSPNLDVRGQPGAITFNSGLTASYELTGKLSLSAGFRYSISDYDENLISSQNISGNLFIDYVYGPKLTIGIGGSIGSELVDEPTTDQTFEQITVRASYELTGKLSANASVGFEIRQFDEARDDHLAPVFTLGIDYTPFDGSVFSLTGSSHTTNSASLVNQDFTNVEFTAAFRQRLAQRFFVSLTLGYSNQAYFETSSSVSATRDDDYYFIQPAIDVKITRYWYAGGFYLHRQNDSSASGFEFEESQVGLRATLTF